MRFVQWLEDARRRLGGGRGNPLIRRQGSAKEAAGEWWRRWRRTEAIPKGTLLYHGTAQEFPGMDLSTPAWFSTSRSVAEHFQDWHAGEEAKRRLLIFKAIRPIRLPRIDGREDLERLEDMFGIQTSYGTEDTVDSLPQSGLPGWIIPHNYPDGDDILLASGDSIEFVGEEPEPEDGGDTDEHGHSTDLPGKWMREDGNWVYHMTPEEIAERERWLAAHPDQQRMRAAQETKVWYHGTSGSFRGFDPDFDYESAEGRIRDYEVPEGVVFLTDDIGEAEAYGPRVVAVKVRATRVLKVHVKAAPSRAFDDDFNDAAGSMWSRFVNGGYDALQVIGQRDDGTPKSTLVTYPELIVQHDKTAAGEKDPPVSRELLTTHNPKAMKPYRPSLVTTEGNPKMEKGLAKGYLTGVMHLMPADKSGYGNVCPFSSAECRHHCLNTAGNWVPHKLKSRTYKTKLYFTDRKRFLEEVRRSIARLARKAEEQGLIPAVRLNGTSDIPSLGLMMSKEFPSIQFYDYTKIPKPWQRMRENYHLTFSRSEENEKEALASLDHGVSVAVVFDVRPSAALPAEWMGYPVIDGDRHDLRFLDTLEGKGPFIVGLRAKGRARGKGGETGFVVKVQPMRSPLLQKRT